MTLLGSRRSSQYTAQKMMIMGHQAKLISPQFVRPFVKGNKNDFVDAGVICEAALRRSMRVVSPQTWWVDGNVAAHQCDCC